MMTLDDVAKHFTTAIIHDGINPALAALYLDIEQYAAEQVVAEREACAALCDAEWNGDSDTYEYTLACNELADAIRARGEGK